MQAASMQRFIIMKQIAPSSCEFLTVKLLCAGAKAYAECALISAFLDKLNPADLMAAQARIWKKSA